MLSGLNPGSGGSGGGSYSFTQNQSAVFGIQPKTCTASAPTNLSVTTEGRNATLTWNTASGAVSYSIYRNDLLIANVTNTSYTDSNLSYGAYNYYVKSRDTNGAASTPTATITIAIEPVPSNLTVVKNGNGAILNWIEPEWAIPQTDDEVLTYGDGNLSYVFGAGDGTNVYFGHKYPASMIDENKVLYKVSFYATLTGAFKLYVYSATAGNSKPQTQLLSQSYTASGTGWNDIILSTPCQINASKDLWVFIYDPEGKDYPMGIEAYTESTNGSYIATSSPTSSVSIQSGYAMLIRTCIDDGSFSYNLYDNNSVVAQNISGNSYTLSSITSKTAHQYSLKANFNGGVTTASNMAGLTKGAATIASLELGDNDKMTILENGTLTVSGTLSNSVAANLVLEPSAQLNHYSDNVKATVKNTYIAYTDDDGWYIIASPFTEFTPSQFAVNNYDLYAYDEEALYGWVNYKAHQTNFPTGSCTGYLYANNPGGTLSSSGTLNRGDYSETIPLSYANSSANVKGYNLLGNPTAHDITFTKSENVSDGYYYLDGGGVWEYDPSNTVYVGTGFLVKANAEGQTVTINPTKSRGDNDASENIAFLKIDVDGEYAYVRMDKGVSMPLLSFRGQSSSVFLTHEGNPYIMLVNNEKQNVNLNYQPKQGGQHELNVTLDGMDLDYLHLIDHLTGADIDLLATPSYTFHSNMTDFASRFKLVFSAKEDNPNDLDNDFAFISNGQLIILGEGTLQVFDALGRQLSSKELSTPHSSLPTPNFPTGVYVLRLTTETGVKTQKIVID